MWIRILATMLLAVPLTMNTALAEGSQAVGMKEDQKLLDRHEVSKAKIDRFVDAQLAVEEVRKDYYTKIRAAEELPTDKDQLKKNMARDITEAVKDSEISADEYKRIAEAARQDMELRNLIFQRMQAKVSAAEGQKQPTN